MFIVTGPAGAGEDGVLPPPQAHTTNMASSGKDFEYQERMKSPFEKPSARGEGKLHSTRVGQ